jgi:hypothetical protein
MTISETRDAQTTRAIPRPRSAEEDGAATSPVAPGTASEPALPVPQYPWPAPWRYSRAARSRSEFWDVETAGWHSRGPYPEPRKS